MNKTSKLDKQTYIPRGLQRYEYGPSTDSQTPSSTTQTPTITPYNLDNAKAAANTGWQAKLDDYGIYSQEERDAIADIFKNAASSAYNTAQTEFSNSMAQQNASLQDTIRRSQAQAVATGASRGMQAANELSAMLGLQQAAASEASAMQNAYAEALSKADAQAYDIQNQINSIGAQMYAADSASDAQKYAANIDAYVNDPYRILTEVANLNAEGKAGEANALLMGWLASMNTSDPLINSAVTGYNKKSDPVTGEVIDTSTKWTAGQNGVLTGNFNGTKDMALNYSDAANGKDETFTYSMNFPDGSKGSYRLKASGAPITNADTELYTTLGKLSNNSNATAGSIVYYNGDAYVSVGPAKNGTAGVWRKLTYSSKSGGKLSFDKFIEALQTGSGYSKD